MRDKQGNQLIINYIGAHSVSPHRLMPSIRLALCCLPFNKTAEFLAYYFNKHVGRSETKMKLGTTQLYIEWPEIKEHSSQTINTHFDRSIILRNMLSIKEVRCLKAL